MKKTSANIVQRLKSGDKSAYEELINDYGDRIYNLSRRILRNQMDAEDVVQETFSTVFEKIDVFQEESNLFTWIYRIATNYSLLKLRSAKKAILISDDLEKYDSRSFIGEIGGFTYPDQSILDTELSVQLQHALDNIPEKYRAVFVLRDLEHLSTAETAEILEITEANVKVRLRRARLFLRDELCGYFERCK